MDLPLRIRCDASTPVNLQIKHQLSCLITSGRLGAGQRLSPVRSVAERLGVNAGTVAQAL